MGCYLLNISVDTADPHPNHIPEDLSINDQESIVELILEQILGYENAIEEYDDNDTGEHKNTTVDIKLIHPVIAGFNIFPILSKIVKKEFFDFKTYISKGFLKLDFPPPKI